MQLWYSLNCAFLASVPYVSWITHKVRVFFHISFLCFVYGWARFHSTREDVTDHWSTPCPSIDTKRDFVKYQMNCPIVAEWRHMATCNWSNIGSDNGLLPDGTKLLPELMFNHHMCSLACTWELFHKKCPWASCQIRKIAGCACAGNAGNVFPAIAG